MINIVPHDFLARCHIKLQENGNREMEAQEHLRPEEGCKRIANEEDES